MEGSLYDLCVDLKMIYKTGIFINLKIPTQLRANYETRYPFFFLIRTNRWINSTPILIKFSLLL